MTASRPSCSPGRVESDNRPNAAEPGEAADYRDMSGPSFRFRLERVRALREQSEDAAKQELAGAIARHDEAEAEVQAAQQRLAQARETQRALGASPGNAGELLARQAYLERTETAHQAQLRELDRHECEVNQRRDTLAAAARDRQALERLKSRRMADHQRESLRLEGVILDEIAGQAFYRGAA